MILSIAIINYCAEFREFEISLICIGMANKNVLLPAAIDVT